MPHTLRLTTLLERDYRQHAYPLQQLKQQLPLIDELCRTLGVSTFSSFIDISAIEWQEAAQLTGQDANSVEADPETGTPLTIEDLSWHPAALGMASLEAVSQHLQRGENLRFQVEDVPPLLTELAVCLEHLAPLEADGGQFHFAAA
ncbi:MAG: hypothetical protein KBT84_09015 [Pseudomonas sp.]|nr:hypothetical protein [Pseudomonas sp.]